MKRGLRVPTFVKIWAERLGADPQSVVRLNGGMNNEIYRCGRKEKWIIKGYPPVYGSSRDRLRAETEFLNFSGQVAHEFTPKVEHIDEEMQCVVLEYLDGRLFEEGVSVPSHAINAAIKFFRLLNEGKDIANTSVSLRAAEGFISISEHINSLKERIERMQINHIQHNIFRSNAEQLLITIKKDFDNIQSSTEELLRKKEVDDEITVDKLCLSPSDFGFHNAIYTSGGIKFIDFEFAGWDDPAKTILDFMLQPRITVPDHTLHLLKGVAENGQASVLKRCKVLLPILELKWVCIIAGVLDKTRLERLELNQLDNSWEDIVRSQIRKAIEYRRKNQLERNLRLVNNMLNMLE